MLIPKLPPVTLLGSVAIEGIQSFTVGSMSSLLGHNIQGYDALPQWPKKQPDATVRDAPRNAPNDSELGQSDSRGHGNQRRPSNDKLEIRDSDSEDNDIDLKGFYGKGGGGGGGKDDPDSSSSGTGTGSGDDGSGSESGSDRQSESVSSEEISNQETDEDDDDEVDEVESVASDSSSVAIPFHSQAKKHISGGHVAAPAPAAVPAPGSHKQQQTTAAPMRRVTKKAATPGGNNNSGSSSILLAAADSQSMNLLDTGAFDSRTTTSSARNAPHPTESSLLSFSADAPASLLPGYESHQPQPQQPAQRSTDTASTIDQLFANPHSNINSALLASSAISSIDVFPNSNPVPVPSNLIIPYGQGPLMPPLSASNYPVLPSSMPSMMMPQPGGYIPAYNAMAIQNPVVNHPATGANQNPHHPSHPVTGVANEEKLSSARSILKPELGGGLGLHMVFRFNVQPVAFAGASSVLLVLKNHSDHTIRYFFDNPFYHRHLQFTFNGLLLFVGASKSAFRRM